MKAFFPETCPKYPRSVMRTGDGIPANRIIYTVADDRLCILSAKDHY